MRFKPKNLASSLFFYLACLVLLINPVVHAQIKIDENGDWVWLCTGNGYSYINFNADSDEQPPEHASQLGGGACYCLFDTALEPEIDVFLAQQAHSILFEWSYYQILHGVLQTYYSPRAPPVKNA